MTWKVYYKTKPSNKVWVKCFESKTRKESERYILSYTNTGMLFMLKRWNEGARRHLPVFEVVR